MKELLEQYGTEVTIIHVVTRRVFEEVYKIYPTGKVTYQEWDEYGRTFGEYSNEDSTAKAHDYLSGKKKDTQEVTIKKVTVLDCEIDGYKVTATPITE